MQMYIFARILKEREDICSDVIKLGLKEWPPEAEVVKDVYTFLKSSTHGREDLEDWSSRRL